MPPRSRKESNKNDNKRHPTSGEAQSHVKHRSILEYANFRWFKVALALCAVSGAVYIWHDPPLKPYGGTWLGYALGTIGALLILWLLYFGVRKRRYNSNVGTAQGWLSAHVYLGVALIVVATLHTGFELGWNVHTLAYVLMILVVASGMYGVFIYLRVPREMTLNAGEETQSSMLMHIADIDKEMREKALSLPDKLFAAVDKSIANTRLGGSFGRVISGRDRACPTAAAVKEMPLLARGLSGEQANLNKEVYQLLLQKNELLQRVRKDMRYKAVLDLWLYIHVPLSIALLAALTIHVVSVFIYW